MKQRILIRRATSAALAACMLFTVSAPALAAAPDLPEFVSAALALEQTNSSALVEETAAGRTIHLDQLTDTDYKVTITVSEENGNLLYAIALGNYQSGSEIAAAAAKPITITGTAVTTYARVEIQNPTSQTAVVALENVSINDGEYGGSDAVRVSGDVTLNFTGENSLIGTYCGINSLNDSNSDAKTLTVNVDGSLTTKGVREVREGAGIYGYKSNLVIKGKNIDAQSPWYGIYVNGGTMTIDSSDVTATGARSGIANDYGDIYLTDSNVKATATSQYNGIGIDAGRFGVTIKGGTVEATGKNYGISGASITDAKVRTNKFGGANLRGNAKVLLTQKHTTSDLTAIETNGLGAEGWLAYQNYDGSITCVVPENKELPNSFAPDDFSTYENVVPSSKYDLANGSIEAQLNADGTYTVKQNGTTYEKVNSPLTVTGEGASGTNLRVMSDGTTDTAEIILNKVTMQQSSLATSVTTTSPLKLTLVGENKLSGGSQGIFAGADLTVTGYGSLTIDDVGNAIEGNFGINIDNTTVTANGRYSGIHSSSDQKDITITRSKVTASGADIGIGSDKNVVVENSAMKASSASNLTLRSGGKVLLDKKLSNGVTVEGVDGDGSSWLAYSDPDAEGKYICIVPEGYKLPDDFNPDNFRYTKAVKASYTITLDENCTAKAGYKPLSSGDTVSYQTSITVTAKTLTGKTFKEWKVTSDKELKLENTSPATFEMPAGNVAIEAVYEDDTPGHVHSYDTLKHDANGHWYECTCGDRQEPQPHNYEQKHDNTNHWDECAVCGETKDTTAHTYVWRSSETAHWQVCEVCGANTAETAHNFVDGKCECGKTDDSDNPGGGDNPGSGETGGGDNPSGGETGGDDNPGSDDIPGTAEVSDSSGGAIAAVVVGGAAVLGGYEVATRVILHDLLPEGAAIPANRGQLAWLIWGTKGAPLPENQPAFTDVSDPEMAMAAQWCVEQGIMDAKSADTFKPDGWTPKFKVIETWNKAFPKAQ